MPAPVEVQYRDPLVKENQDKIGTKSLQFTVVNGSEPVQYFEDLPKIDLSGEPAPVGPSAPVPAVVGPIEMITIPDFKVIYQTMKNQNHSVPLNNYRDEMFGFDPQSIDPTKASPAILRNIANGLRIVYMNRFNISLNGITRAKYTWNDGTVIEEVCDSVVDQTPLLYDNIPAATVLAREGTSIDDVPDIVFSTEGDVQMVLYMPIKMKDRFNLGENKLNDRLYRFEYYFMNAGETVNSKVFNTAKDSLIHVVNGSVTIGEYTVERQNFYRHDGTQSVAITAGANGAVVVISTKVEDYID